MRGRSGVWILLVVAFVATAAALLASSRSATAAAPSSWFAMDSDPGHRVGRGQSVVITSSDGTFTPGATVTDALTISSPDRGTFSVQIWARGVTPITAGSYVAGPNDIGDPEAIFTIRWSASASFTACTTATTDLVVHDVAYDGGRMTRLSASFASGCRGLPETLTGEIRFESLAPAVAAIDQQPLRTEPFELGPTAVGDRSATQTVTLRSAGTRPVTFGTAERSGDHPDDIRITTDTCSGSTFAPGSSCTLEFLSAPTAAGVRRTIIDLPTDTPSGHRRIEVRGRGLLPTTTTLHVPSGLARSPVELRATVDPSPWGDTIAQVQFDVVGFPGKSRKGRVWQNAEAMVAIPLDQGRYQVVATFIAIDDFIGSTSETLTVEVGQVSSAQWMDVEADPLSSRSTPMTVRVEEPTLGGGRLTITDLTTGVELGTTDLTDEHRSLTISPRLDAGDHLLEARFSGDGLWEANASRHLMHVRLDDRIDADAAISSDRLYPAKDGYNDLLRIAGIRREPVSVEVAIEDSATDELVFQQTIPAAAGKWSIEWDGRRASGGRAPAGSYRVVVTQQDPQPNTAVAKAAIRLSWDSFTWKERTTVLRGSQFALAARAGNGRISLTRSGYKGGVRLDSRNGLAAVQYRFAVPAADAYKPVSFEVFGRERNGNPAYAAIWNPRLGSFKRIDTFDAAHGIGMIERWWKTGAPMDGRVRDGALRASVLAAYGIGRREDSIVDIAKVRIRYAIGTRIGGAAGDAAPAVVAEPDELRVQGTTLRRLLPRRDRTGADIFTAFIPD